MRFAGDFRLRSESFFREGSPNRSRLRIQLRAGFTLPVNGRFTFGLRLASGIPGNVTSANVDLSDAFTQKTFRLDRAYLTWTPHARVEITGGKFGVPVWRPEALVTSQLMYDEDLAPEGFHEAITLVSAEAGLVRRLSVLGHQWSLLEVGGGDDSWMLGGQAILELRVASRTGLDLGLGYFGYLNGRGLAQARNDNDELLVTNSVVTRSGTLVPGGTALAPSPGDPFDRFVSAFRVVHGGLGLRREGVLGRSLAATAEWAHNDGASVANDGFLLGVSWGAARRPGDWGVGLAWTRVEQEAVLSMFSYSDLGFGGTNMEGGIVQVAWRPAPGLTLQVRDHIVSPIAGPPGANPNTLHRLQVDARVSF